VLYGDMDCRASLAKTGGEVDGDMDCRASLAKTDWVFAMTGGVICIVLVV
jgi:hypothetical protein